MFYRICALVIAILFIPVVNISTYAESGNVQNNVDKYIYYNVDGDNFMSDHFNYSKISDIISSWVYRDENCGKAFHMKKEAGTNGGIISVPLRANIEDKSNITLFYDFMLDTSSDTTYTILPSFTTSTGKYFYINGTTLMHGGAALYELEKNRTYGVKCVKASRNVKLYIASGSDNYEYIKTVNDGVGSASKLYFGYEDCPGDGTVWYDNFKLCSNNEDNQTEEYTPQYFNVFYNVDDDENSVKKLIGTNTVFTSDIYFYANGSKLLYSDYMTAPVYETEKLWIETEFFADAHNLSCAGNVIGGMDFSQYIKNIKSESYIDVSAASDKLGFYVYEDERGFVVSGNTQSDIYNSHSPFEIKESADSVYRYMYFDRADAGEILKQASVYRPRILTNDESLQKMAMYLETDITMQNWKQNIITKADNILDTPYVEYQLVGVRLLSAAQNVLSRCVYMASAYYLTGDSKYAYRCIGEMKNACAWSDWNTSQHYLDNSELCYAMAIGYDTFYDFISDEDKKYIIEKTTEHSLAISVSAYEGQFKDMGSEWRYSSGNWGAVCAGGMTAALISFAGEEWGMPSSTQEYLLSNAMHSMEYPAMLYYPDGSWSEGTGYWKYATEYFLGAFLGSLYFSTGKTWGFLRPEGVCDCLSGLMHLQSESSGTFNFADSTISFIKSPVGFVFAKMTSNPAAMSGWSNFYSLKNSLGDPYAILWYEPYKQPVADMQTDVWLRSAGAGVMREKWFDRQSAYVGVKGGQNHTNHDNLDLGTFIFDALGERWAMELGKDNYNIQGGYWGLSGYELYVKRPEGQNCLVINPEKGDIYGEYYQQKLDCFASLTSFVSKPRGAYMVLDLTDANSMDVTSYQRGYYFGDERKSLVVQDELELIHDNSTLYWAMHTEADIDVSEDGKGATLTIGNSTLKVALDTNADIKISSSPAVALPGTVVRSGENSREHINKLLISGTGSGNVYITVKLTPQYDYTKPDENANYVPISQWEIPDGAKKENIRIYPFGNTYIADINSDFCFSAYLPQDFEKCQILTNDKVACELGAVKRGESRLTIPANSVTQPGDVNIRVRGYTDGAIVESLELPVHFASLYSDEAFDVIDFEGKSVSDNASDISKEYNIDSVSTKNKSAFSIESIQGNRVLKFSCEEKISSSYPFIRKRFAPISHGRAVFEFDLMAPGDGSIVYFETRASDNSYASFDMSRSSIPLLTKDNKLGNSSYAYPQNRFCHVEVVIDLDLQTYIVRADGVAVSEGQVAIKDVIYLGLNLGNANASGGITYIDNISVASQCIKDDITESKYITGFCSDVENEYTVYMAYYFGKRLVYLEKQLAVSDCVKCEFDKQNINADCVKLITMRDEIIPCRENCIYLYEIG